MPVSKSHSAASRSGLPTAASALAALVTLIALLASSACSSTPPTASATGPAPKELSPEAAIRAWFAASNDAANTGVTDDLLDLSTGDCVSCTTFAQQVAATYAARGFADAPAPTVLTLTPEPNISDRYRAVVLTPGETLQSSLHASYRHFEGGTLTYSLQVRADATTHRVSEVHRIPEDAETTCSPGVTWLTLVIPCHQVMPPVTFRDDGRPSITESRTEVACVRESDAGGCLSARSCTTDEGERGTLHRRLTRTTHPKSQPPQWRTEGHFCRAHGTP